MVVRLGRTARECALLLRNDKGRGWDSVVVEESDVLACGGYLPERYIGVAGGGDCEAEPAAAVEMEVPILETASSESENAETCDTDLNEGRVGGGTREERAEAGDRGRDEGVARSGDDVRVAEKSPNEANLCDDVCIAQREEIIDIPANSGGSSGLDSCQAKPIFLETKPISAGGPEAVGVGGPTKLGEAGVVDGPRAVGRVEGNESAGVDSLAGGERGARAGAHREVEFGGREHWPREPKRGDGGRGGVAGCAGGREVKAGGGLSARRREAPRKILGGISRLLILQVVNRPSLDQRSEIERIATHCATGENPLLQFVARNTVNSYATSAARLDAVFQDRKGADEADSYALTRRLRMIARMIKAGLSTSIYYTQLGGFDTHAEQLNQHAGWPMS